ERDAVLRAQEELEAARFQLQKAFADRAIALAQESETAQTKALEDAYQKRNLDAQQFYTAQQHLAEQTSQAQINAIEDELDFENKRLADLDKSEQARLASARQQSARAKNAQDREKIALDQQKISLDVEKKRVEITTQITNLETKLLEIGGKQREQ